MNNEETIKKLKEVQSLNLPRVTYLKLKEWNKVPKDFEETEENIKLMDTYLNKFLDPRNEYCKNECWLCGNEVMIRWGLAHGIAYSHCCGLRYVCYHYSDDIVEKKEKKLFKGKIDITLQYHPDTFYIEGE